MGLFWDLLQESKISSQQQRSDSIEKRVARLETELQQTRKQLHALVSILEREYGRDLDGDGRVG